MARRRVGILRFQGKLAGELGNQKARFAAEMLISVEAVIALVAPAARSTVVLIKR